MCTESFLYWNPVLHVWLGSYVPDLVNPLLHAPPLLLNLLASGVERFREIAYLFQDLCKYLEAHTLPLFLDT